MQLCRASYHKYHILQGSWLCRNPGCLSGLGTAGGGPHRLLNDTKGRKVGEIYVLGGFLLNMVTTSVCVPPPHLSRYEVSRSLWWAWERQLLPRDHHHLWPGLINVRGRHRPGAAAGRDAPWRAGRRQVGSVVVIGLDRRQGSRWVCDMGMEWWKMEDKYTQGEGGGQQKSFIFISRSVTLNNRSFFHTTLSYGAFRDLPEHKSTHSLTLKL